MAALAAVRARHEVSFPRKQVSASGQPAQNEQVHVFDSALGWMAARWRDAGLVRFSFGWSDPAGAREAVDEDHSAGDAELTPAQSALLRRLTDYARGGADDFRDIRLPWESFTEFQQQVMQACRRIPAGRTLTYAELAAQVGHPGAARAVGNVMANNPFPLLVPCHRVVGSGGSLGGYSGPRGLAMKRELLARERADHFRSPPRNE